MKILTTQQLLEMAYGLQGELIDFEKMENIFIKNAERGVNFVAFTAVTEYKTNKKHNPYYPIYKVAQRKATLKLDYETTVNRNRAKEGLDTDFKADPLWGGGNTVEGNIIKRGDKRYLKLLRPEDVTSFYVYETSPGVWEEISYETAQQYAPPRKEYSEKQGTDKQEKPRNYALTSIYGFTLDKKEYIVEDNLADLQPMIDPVASKLRK